MQIIREFLKPFYMMVVETSRMSIDVIVLAIPLWEPGVSRTANTLGLAIEVARGCA